VLLAARGRADDFERDPIAYSKTAPNNAIVRLQQRLDQGRLRLDYHQDLGYLPAVLHALAVPESSQVLVFSKTSMQRSRISPRTPRALYFNDEVYVGYCQDGQVMEISAADPQLGTVFYTLEQHQTQTPRFTRQTDACLLCHGSSQTEHVPGHVIRSVYSDRSGEPILSLGTHRVDHTTPLEDRWGGWYVTGTHGKQVHLGNLVVQNGGDRETIAKNPAGQNVTDLKRFLDTTAYLTPHSDIVALIVLEHQTELHNLITRASFLTRRALHEQLLLNKELGRNDGYESETTYRRIRAACEPLVRYLLFSREAPLTGKVQGTSSFAKEFAAAGPRDSRGRSLRDFDLERRLFKYPCSYLIYSEPFAHLPTAAKDYVYRRLHMVLTNRDFEHLKAADREAVLEILRETKSDLPEYWHRKER
jgi:hypothetical protein